MFSHDGFQAQPPPLAAVTAAAEQSDPPATPEGETYKRPTRLALVLQVMLAFWIVVAAAFAAWALALYDFVGDLQRSPLGVDPAALDEVLGRASALGIAELVLLLITGGFFIAWTYRVYSNLPALGARGLTYGRKWAIGGWFVPFLNLLRPKQVIDIVWKVSHPDHGLAPGTAWKSMKVSPLVHWWWGLFITMRVLTQFFDAGAASSIEAGRTQALTLVVAGVFKMAAAVLAFMLVTRITTNQIERYDRIVVSAGLGNRPIRHRRWGLRPVAAWMAGMAMVALALGAVTYSLSNLDGTLQDDLAVRDGSGAIVSAGGLLLEDLRIGDCYNDPDEFGAMLAVEAVPCSSPHDNEVFALLQLPAELHTSYPGENSLFVDAGSRCVGEMPGYVGAGYNESGLDLFTIVPTPQTWSLGDRRVICSAYDLGLARLGHSIQSTGGVIPDGFASALSLAVGDCYQESYEALVPLVACGESHLGFVFDAFDLEAQSLPANVDIEATDRCQQSAARSFSDLDRAGVEVFPLRWPTDITWAAGEREVVCVAVDVTSAS